MSKLRIKVNVINYCVRCKEYTEETDLYLHDFHYIEIKIQTAYPY